MFQETLGELYDPAVSWTSTLRSRAGLPEFRNEDCPVSVSDHCTPSPFTLTGRELSVAVWKLLSNAILEHPVRVGFSLDITYHFEVGMILDESNGKFTWRHSDVERVRIT